MPHREPVRTISAAIVGAAAWAAVAGCAAQNVAGYGQPEAAADARISVEMALDDGPVHGRRIVRVDELLDERTEFDARDFRLDELVLVARSEDGVVGSAELLILDWRSGVHEVPAGAGADWYEVRISGPLEPPGGAWLLDLGDAVNVNLLVAVLEPRPEVVAARSAAARTVYRSVAGYPRRSYDTFWVYDPARYYVHHYHDDLWPYRYFVGGWDFRFYDLRYRPYRHFHVPRGYLDYRLHPDYRRYDSHYDRKHRRAHRQARALTVREEHRRARHRRLARAERNAERERAAAEQAVANEAPRDIRHRLRPAPQTAGRNAPASARGRALRGERQPPRPGAAAPTASARSAGSNTRIRSLRGARQPAAAEAASNPRRATSSNTRIRSLRGARQPAAAEAASNPRRATSSNTRIRSLRGARQPAAAAAAPSPGARPASSNAGIRSLRGSARNAGVPRQSARPVSAPTRATATSSARRIERAASAQSRTPARRLGRPVDARRSAVPAAQSRPLTRSPRPGRAVPPTARPAVPIRPAQPPRTPAPSRSARPQRKSPPSRSEPAAQPPSVQRRAAPPLRSGSPPGRGSGRLERK